MTCSQGKLAAPFRNLHQTCCGLPLVHVFDNSDLGHPLPQGRGMPPRKPVGASNCSAQMSHWSRIRLLLFRSVCCQVPGVHECSFARRYCAKHGLLPGQYEQAVLLRSLHLAARLLYPLLACHHSYFSADRALVCAAGRCLTLWDFDTEALDYPNHPDNRGWLRGTLKLRLSVAACAGWSARFCRMTSRPGHRPPG